nr:probable phosphoribosylformylglycinamidine synthase, chloroplastic/mitochondrial [Tanacetum cinerariifolium]
MAATHSLDIKAAQSLQGSNNCNFFLPKPLPKSRNTHLLFGSSRKKNGSVRICSKGVRRNGSRVKAVLSVDTQVGDVENAVKEKVIHFYRTPFLQENKNEELLKSVQAKISDQIVGLKTEKCFNIGVDGNLSKEKVAVLKWLLQETYEPENIGEESFVAKETKDGYETVVVEVGPRLSFTTAWSANVVSICKACGLS